VGSAIAGLVRRHPLVAFSILAYALSWWAWPLYAAGLLPVPIASFGPFLAALVVLSLTHGRAGVVTLLRRMGRWRVGLGWYAVAFALPAAIAGGAAGLNVLLGAQALPVAPSASWTGLVTAFLLLLLVPGYGGAWEEPGWRGYAQPALQARRPALRASLLLGVLVAGWHVPLFATGDGSWAELGSIVGGTVVLAWVFNGSGGSVLLTMLLHATNNTASGLFGRQFAGADAVTLGWLLSGLWCLAALAVVVVAGPARLSRRERVPLVGPTPDAAQPAGVDREPPRPAAAAAPSGSI
jgi:membrane protease YdiL (CAAX protease family)